MTARALPPYWTAAWLAIVSSALGACVAAGLADMEQPAWLVVAAGVGLLGILALAIARYEAAVALGFLLFAVVRYEPAPSDAIFAVVIAVAVATGRFDLRRTPAGPALGVAAFVVVNLVGCFELVAPARAARFASITVYVLVFGLWVATWVDGPGRARRLVRIYVALAIVSALAGILALFHLLPGHDILTAYHGTRARALFKDPDVFGPFLVPAILIVLHETLEPRLLRSSRPTKLAALAVLVAGVLFSYSRGAWINLAVGALVLGVVVSLQPGGARRAVVLGSVVFVAAIAGVVSIEATGQLSFLAQRARVQGYDSQRLAAQTGGVALGLTHPIGIGPGQFEVYEPISSHNTYVRALAEEGPAGFVILLALLLGTLLVAMRNAVRGWDTGGIASAVLLAAWCGMLVQSLFLDTLHWRHLWLVAGLIWAAAATQASSRAAAGSPT